MTTHFQYTTRGLIVTGNPTIEDWLAEFGALKTNAKGMYRKIGDMLTWGELTYGDLSHQVNDSDDCDDPIFNPGTLYNAKWVSSRWWPVDRRIYDLPWSYYQETSALKPEQQDLVMAMAEAKKWNRDQIRLEVAKYQQFNGKRDYKPLRPDDIIFDQQQRLQALQEQIDQKSHAALDSQSPAESPITYGGTLPDGSTLTEWEQDQIRAIGDVAKNNGWLSVTVFEDGRFMVEPKKDGD
jgi:hypothetical protein